ncbi:hypothetical protein CAQUA_10300 [Corynebacterium aquatimens]|uniref:Uncharacterized protein n=1 Tax=Corynebacterium aquatimens TaxID=1190508 RepID=A0A931E286_9CORY|nr:hypothetical protein [Corynebacterium aquatimens]WJY66747.1 hypothetical protein CAQUA_10300 [Corynebacterium aquatimens]
MGVLYVARPTATADRINGSDPAAIVSWNYLAASTLMLTLMFLTCGAPLASV